MDSRYRFFTFGIPWTQSMPSRDVNVECDWLKLVGGVINSFIMILWVSLFYTFSVSILS